MNLSRPHHLLPNLEIHNPNMKSSRNPTLLRKALIALKDSYLQMLMPISSATVNQSLKIIFQLVLLGMLKIVIAILTSELKKSVRNTKSMLQL